MTLAQPLKNEPSTAIKQSTCAYGAYWCVGCGVDISVQNNIATAISGTPEHHDFLVYPVRVQPGEVQLFV